jgi:hypothetical protein
MLRRLGGLMVALTLAGAPAAMAQPANSTSANSGSTNSGTVRTKPVRRRTAAGAIGQQRSQPSPTQNQPQQQTDNSQQPPNAHVLPPTASSQAQPNPLPQLAK